MLLLLGFADSGVIEAARSVMDQQTVSLISTELPGKPESEPFNFTLVVETEGMNQAIFKSQVKYFVHRLSPSAAGAENRRDTSQAN